MSSATFEAEEQERVLWFLAQLFEFVDGNRTQLSSPLTSLPYVIFFFKIWNCLSDIFGSFQTGGSTLALPIRVLQAST